MLDLNRSLEHTNNEGQLSLDNGKKLEIAKVSKPREPR